MLFMIEGIQSGKQYLGNLYQRNRLGLQGSNPTTTQKIASAALAGVSLPLSVALDQVIPRVKPKDQLKAKPLMVKSTRKLPSLLKKLAQRQKEEGLLNPPPSYSSEKLSQMSKQQKQKQKQKPKKGGGKKKSKGQRSSITGATNLGNKSNSGTLLAPPTIFGTVRDSGMRLSFSSGTRPGCMRVKGSMLAATLHGYCESASDIHGLLAFHNAVPSNLTCGTWFPMMPQNSFYFQTPVFIFAQLFTRYRMKTKIEFRTRMATSDRGNLKIVYIEDPTAFFATTGKVGRGLTSAANVTSADLAGYPSVMEGPIWTNWETGWSHIPPGQDYNYTAAVTYSEAIDLSSNDAINVRQPIAGAWLFATNGIATPSTVGNFLQLGEVWVHYDLEVCDLMTVAVSYEPMPSLRRPLPRKIDVFRQLLEEKEQREEKDRGDRVRSRERSRSPLSRGLHSLA
jgi:hypothetical protein